MSFKEKAKLKKGQVFLWSGISLPSYLIKRITNSKWSHCGWVLSSEKIIDANWTGVKIRNIDRFLKRPDRFKIYELDLPEQVIDKCVNYALSKRTSIYDYKLLLSIFMAYTFNKRCHEEAREWDRGYICSELVAEPLHEFADIKFVNTGTDVDFTTPGDIGKNIDSYAKIVL